MSWFHTYHPRITFQDTNVVGNVYFLTFFRWQAECLHQWLRIVRPALWDAVRSGDSQFLIASWSTRFDDPIGATIGDDVSLSTTFEEISDGYLAASAISRHRGQECQSIASGRMTFVDSVVLPQSTEEPPTGLCYSLSVTNPRRSEMHPLDLLSWQGKCRELFLADYAPESLHLVSSGKLALQTTSASVDLLQCPQFPIDEVRVELRLETLKCGQMGIRFDYFVDVDGGDSIRFAKGQQRASSKSLTGNAATPCPFPADILHALGRFTDSGQLLAKIDDILKFSVADSAP